MNRNGDLYVARYDFSESSNKGVISVLNEGGEVRSELTLNECAEITGLYFSKV
jgi:hypothetical protein